MSVEQAEKKQVLLIQPVSTDHKRLTQGLNKFPPLGLRVLKERTPKNWDVKIVDEGIEPFNIGKITNRPDVVGISCWTNQAPRAYELAEAFRRIGVTVILGGPHPTLRPDEARCYADCVFVGEADVLWPEVLDDEQNGNLQRIYQGGMVPPEQIPILRHPGKDKYTYGSIQTARGCPYKCKFCSVTEINGAVIRYRPIADVVEELRNNEHKFMLFADDNIIGSGERGRERALALFKAIVKDQRRTGERKFWGTQATQTLGQEENNELLKWMYKAGCRIALLGLESINQQVLKDVKKGINKVADFKKNIRNIQRHGIAVLGSFVFGLDSEDPNVFNATVRFIRESGMAAQNLNLLCPLPGTETFDEFLQSGRLLYTDFPKDYERYDLKNVVIDPKSFSPRELCIKQGEAEHQLNRRLTLLRRTARTFWETRSFYATVIALLWNMGGSLRMRDYRDRLKLLEENGG